MNNDFKKIYKAINNIFDLSKNECTANLSFNKKAFFRKISTKNKFYIDIDINFLEEQYSSLNYSEFRIRVWKNGLAEVIMFKLPEFSEYHNIYTFAHGYQLPNKLLQFEASNAFLKLTN